MIISSSCSSRSDAHAALLDWCDNYHTYICKYNAVVPDGSCDTSTKLDFDVRDDGYKYRDMYVFTYMNNVLRE